ncbi:MAG TPA: MBL fold metallo-hydrolase [Mycobacteriales bacterium]
MRLTVVGCSGSMPGPAGPASSYLVEHDGVHLLLDLGNGALGALQRHLDPSLVDAVLLSHLHADHCLDMCAYVVHRRYAPGGPRPPVPVHGPGDTARRLTTAYGPPDGGLDDVFAFSALADGRREIGPFTLTTARVNHPVETYATRVEAAGRSLTYSADTGVSDALVELARGTDLLLCEATFAAEDDAPPDLHLTGREAGEHAARAGVDRLVLTHIPPWNDPIRTLDDASAVFDGAVEVAVPAATYAI